MRRIRKLLFTAALSAAMLLPLAGAASADPNDGGFTDPVINAGPVTVTVLGPNGGATVVFRSAVLPAAATTAADPNDGGFGP